MNYFGHFRAANKHPRNTFTQSEDKELKRLVNEYGEDWQEIADRMRGRNTRQCRERWQKYLDPEINRDPWTKEEDEYLVEKFNEIGPLWKIISQHFPQRTDIMVKNRFHLLERRKMKEEMKKLSMKCELFDELTRIDQESSSDDNENILSKDNIKSSELTKNGDFVCDLQNFESFLMDQAYQYDPTLNNYFSNELSLLWE